HQTDDRPHLVHQENKNRSSRVIAGLRFVAETIRGTQDLSAARKQHKHYLPAISKLTFASSFAFTVTFWVLVPSFSCHIWTLYVPGGTSVSLKLPSFSVTA